MTFTPNFSTPSSLPPQAIDGEEAVLGSILLDPNAIKRVADTLIPEAFFIDSHKEIYRAALAIYGQGMLVDLMTVCSYLHDRQRLEKIGGQQKLAQLVGDTVTSVNVDRYADLVMDKYHRRQLIDAGHEIAQLARETWLSQETLREQIQNKLLGKNGLLASFSNESQRSQNRYRQLISEVEQIEMTIEEPGLKRWELKRIASKFGASMRTLEELWHRHLIHSGELEVQTWEDIRREASETQEWVMHGLLPKQGLVLMHATGGVGKTRLFYDWAFSLTIGEPWNGIFSVTGQRRRVLLIQTDESTTEMFLALEARGFTEQHDIIRLKNWDIENIAGLHRKIKQLEPDVILVDSLNSVSSNFLVSENDAEYARPILSLRKLSESLGKLIFLIHHSNKEGDVRGSSAIKAACSMEMKLAKDPQFPQIDSTRRILTIGKTRSYRRPAEYALEFEPETGKWIWLGEHSQQETGDPDLPLKDRIVNFLSQRRNKRLELEEIHHEIGGKIDSIRRATYQLATDGLISRIKKGKCNLYFLAWEEVQMNHRSDHQPNRISDDQIDDQERNNQTAGVTGFSDPRIGKKIIFDAPTEEKKVAILDRNEKIEVQNQPPASDTESDPTSDPHPILSDRDREFTSAQNEGESTQEPLPISDSSGEQVPESCNDSVTNDGGVCDRDREGDRKTTPGSNPSLQNQDDVEWAEEPPFEIGEVFEWWGEEVRVCRIGVSTLYCQPAKGEEQTSFIKVPFAEAEQIKSATVQNPQSSTSSPKIHPGQWGRIKGLGWLDGVLIQAVEAPHPTNGSLLAKAQNGDFDGVLPSTDNFAPLSQTECLERGLNFIKPNSTPAKHPPYNGKTNRPQKGDRVRRYCGVNQIGQIAEVRVINRKQKYVIQWQDGQTKDYELDDFGTFDIRRES